MFTKLFAGSSLSLLHRTEARKALLKPCALVSLALGALVLFAVPVVAGDAYYRPGYHGHPHFQDQLGYQGFPRHSYHQEAHRYPMISWQHKRLHDNLEQDAYPNWLQQRPYHQQYAPSYPGRGWGISGPGFYFQFRR